jgi:Reverse transcriptase (RNA-dependent DNA polymerase)
MAVARSIRGEEQVPVGYVALQDLYGCVESAALWYDNLSQSMENLGYKSNKYEPCVFNRLDERGTQCTATVHVDDLFISSKSGTMLKHLCGGLKKPYGDITRKDGPVVSYLGDSMVKEVSVRIQLSRRSTARPTMTSLRAKLSFQRFAWI